MRNFSFRPNERIKNKLDFDAVYKNGVRYYSKYLVLIAFEEKNILTTRLGISISRKVGKSNIRNIWKRHIREFFRMHKILFKPKTDYLFIVKVSAHDINKKNIKKVIENDINKLVKQFYDSKPDNYKNN
jgi:ribonuclease P protein component